MGAMGTSKLDIVTIAGLLLGMLVVLVGILMGSGLGLFINIPSVFITVFGSFASVAIQFGLKEILTVVKVARQTIFEQVIDLGEVVGLFGDLARKARREGLLGLEDELSRLEDKFYRKGLRMVVDAIDPELMRQVLEADMEATAQRHDRGQAIFKSWAAMAPAFGMIGTLIGLIQMLNNLDDPSALGPGMAVALITTFYGSLMANLIFTPLAGKLAMRSEDEMLMRQIMLEGFVALQSGTNPRVLEDYLGSFLPPGGRASQREEAGGRGLEF